MKSEEKVFTVPWGSESICYWCKKAYKCQYYTEDKEVAVLMLPHHVPIKRRPTQLMNSGQLCRCPINEFEPDSTKLPEEFKNCTIVVRKYESS